MCATRTLRAAAALLLLAIQAACAVHHGGRQATETTPRYRGLMPAFAFEPGKPKRENAEYKRQGKPDLAWMWFYNHRVNENWVVPIAYREEALEHTKRYNQKRPKDVAAAWSYVGPGGQVDAPSNGRIIDLAVHPQNEQIIYAATAGGGVWKTINQGQSWTNLTDGKIPSLGCGSLVMQPGNPETLLLGLGEGNKGFGNDVDPLGTGIYRTTDGGQTWNLVPGTGNGTMQFVGDIRFVDANTILAAAWGGYQLAGRGLWRSTDGGQNWTRIVDEPAVSISVDPTNSNNVALTTWVVETGVGTTTRFYYSTNGGASFNPATYPNATGCFRAELARDPTTPTKLYALVASGDSKLKGIWSSTNGGQNWSALTTSGIPAGDSGPGQMNYNNCIAVSPNDSNRLYFGSNLRSYRSQNGGLNWTPMTDWNADDGDGIPYIHADHHVIAFGSTGNTIYMGTDGGFFMSSDGGATWIERNEGLDCTQIYRIANHPTIANALIMGTQDNDKYVRRPDGTWRHWPNSFGDCMEVAVDTLDAQGDGFYGMNYFGTTMRYTGNGSQSWNDFLRTYTGYPEINSTPNGIPDNEQGAWVAPLLVDPQHPRSVWVILQNVYRQQFTPGAVAQWQQLATINANYVPGGTFEIADLSSGTNNRQLYAALNRFDQVQQVFDPGILRMDIGDGLGAASNAVFPTPPRPGILGTLKCDPVANDSIWVTYTDYGQNKANPAGRVYMSPNKGQSWENRTGNLPSHLPVSAIFVDPEAPATLVVGTDLGCYRSDDGGATWYEYNDGLPNAVVTDLD